jgi:hypothetical protein
MGLQTFNGYFVILLYRHWPGLTIGCGDGVAVVKVGAAGYGIAQASLKMNVEQQVFHRHDLAFAIGIVADRATANIALQQNNAICCRFCFQVIEQRGLLLLSVRGYYQSVCMLSSGDL